MIWLGTAMGRLTSFGHNYNPLFLTILMFCELLCELAEYTAGTLSEDDGDGSENFAKKMNLRAFKLNRVCLDPLNMSNAGDFSWSWILKDFIQVKKDEGKFVDKTSN